MTPYIDLNTKKFDIAVFKTALKKRYRDEFDPTDVQGAFDDAIAKEQTLGEAVKELVDLYVKTDGHDRNLILTAEELVARKDRNDKLGILKAVINAVSKPNGASEADIKLAVRTQMTMRKLQTDPINYGSHLVSTLCEKGLVTFTAAVYEYGKLKKPANWTIFKAPRARSTAFEKLSDQDKFELCPALYVPKITEGFRRPRQEAETY